MFAEAYTPVTKEPWRGSRLADSLLVVIPLLAFIGQLFYYRFSTDCTFGVLELGNDEVDLNDDPFCRSTPVARSINYVDSAFSGTVFVSMLEINAAGWNDCFDQLYISSGDLDYYIINNQDANHAFWLYFNSSDGQSVSIEAVVFDWQFGAESYSSSSSYYSTTLDPDNVYTYQSLAAGMICYYATPEWNEPYECDRCTDRGWFEAISLSLPITTYSFTAIVLMIQFAYPRCCPSHIQSHVDNVKRLSSIDGLGLPGTQAKNGINKSAILLEQLGSDSSELPPPEEIEAASNEKN